MPQTTDIILNGDPYMLAPGKGRGGYTRSQDGMNEGRTGRAVQTDFFGGTRRPVALEGDRGWSSSGIGPAYGGAGVHPWPFWEFRTIDDDLPVFDEDHPLPYLVLRDYVYFGVGDHIARTAAIGAGTWSAPDTVHDAGETVTSMCYYGGNMLYGCGADKDITHVVYPDLTSPATLFTGERGTFLMSYAGFALWDDQRSGWWPSMIRLVNGTGIDTRWGDSPVSRIVTAQGSVMIATSAAIYQFSGHVQKVTIPDPGNGAENIEIDRWTGELEPYFQHGSTTSDDDYRFVVGFGGRLYAWVGKTVMEHDPEGNRAGWKDTGLGGQECYGACVAAGYLVVSIRTLTDNREVWAFDGSGWWRIFDGAGVIQPLQPIPLAGVGGYDVMVPTHGGRVVICFRLVPRSSALHTVHGTFSHYTTSLIDAGERDKAKAWRKVGAIFANPEVLGNDASSDAVTVRIDYSIDGGETWSTGPGTVLTGNSLANQNVEIERDLAPAAAVSHLLQLRIVWSSASDWAPVLVGTWAEFEVLDSPARRRRWTFTVIAQDQVIDRDGATLTRTGREMISELWDHWQDGTTVPFRDLDYDDVEIERQVRIVGISERVEAPHQAGMWGDSAVSLTLVEV